MCAWLFAIYLAQAQAPQLISYQAVARDLTGKVLSERPISVQVEILQGSNQGTAVYTETHELITTKTGTINLLIGGGNAQVGTFAEIDWSKAPYFLRLGMKQKKETEYTEVSNTQMVSVPYALYAQYAQKAKEVENSETNSTKKYTIVPTDNRPQYLYCILTGGTLETGYQDLDTTFSIVYLNGIDQQINVTIEGLPENVSQTNGDFPSSNYGRLFSIRTNSLSKGEYQLILTIKDNTNTVLEEYPFTFISK